MMAIIRLLLLLIILAITLPFFPWWIAMVICTIDGFISNCQKCAVLRGSMALAIVWFCTILIRHFTGSEILFNRVAEMMGLGSGIYLAMIMIILSITIGGLSSFTGNQIRTAIIK